MKPYPAFDARIGSVTGHTVDPNVESSNQAMARLQDIRPETAQDYIRAGETLGRLLKRFPAYTFRFGSHGSAKTA